MIVPIHDDDADIELPLFLHLSITAGDIKFMTLFTIIPLKDQYIGII